MQPHSEDNDACQEIGHFENYANYSRTLRAWFVAYGIGGPVLCMTNDHVSKQIAKSDNPYIIVNLFLVGVGLQIILALINKWGAWHMYRGAGDAEYQGTRKYRFWRIINSHSGIDFWVDVFSLATFVFATWLVLKAILKVGA